MKRFTALLVLTVFVAMLVVPATASAATHTGSGWSTTGSLYYTDNLLGARVDRVYASFTKSSTVGKHFCLGIDTSVYSGVGSHATWYHSGTSSATTWSWNFYPNKQVDQLIDAEQLQVRYGNSQTLFDTFNWNL